VRFAILGRKPPTVWPAAYHPAPPTLLTDAVPDPDVQLDGIDFGNPVMMLQKWAINIVGSRQRREVWLSEREGGHPGVPLRPLDHVSAATCTLLAARVPLSWSGGGACYWDALRDMRERYDRAKDRSLLPADALGVGIYSSHPNDNNGFTWQGNAALIAQDDALRATVV
jgi:hypothetical protein